MNRQVCSLLGLCQKAGLLVSGEFACEKALQSQTAQLVLISEDASDNTKKKFLNKAYHYQVPTLVYGQKQALSSAIGKANRAVAVVTDQGFGNKIREKINCILDAPS